MKPIDDPRFAEAVRLFEQEYASMNLGDVVKHQRAGFAAKPSPQTHYRTMANLRTAVFARLDAAGQVETQHEQGR